MQPLSVEGLLLLLVLLTPLTLCWASLMDFILAENAAALVPMVVARSWPTFPLTPWPPSSHTARPWPPPPTAEASRGHKWVPSCRRWGGPALPASCSPSLLLSSPVHTILLYYWASLQPGGTKQHYCKVNKLSTQTKYCNLGKANTGGEKTIIS